GAQRIIFEADDGSTLELGYNRVPEGRGQPTVQPQPDFVLTLERKVGGRPVPGGVHRLIFDAKYRVEASPKYQEHRGGVGPKEDDINTMHRSRDAFLTVDPEPQPYQRDVTTPGGLSPWTGPYPAHNLARSPR